MGSAGAAELTRRTNENVLAAIAALVNANPDLGGCLLSFANFNYRHVHYLICILVLVLFVYSDGCVAGIVRVMETSWNGSRRTRGWALDALSRVLRTDSPARSVTHLQ